MQEKNEIISIDDSVDESRVNVKIKSNPYDRQIDYYAYDNTSHSWRLITVKDNSDLVSDELTHGFFPYYVDRILEEIEQTYNNHTDKIVLHFEGTDDEFQHLKQMCSDEKYKDVIELLDPVASLENAKDILPVIADIFQKMQPLIEESVRESAEVTENRRKFVEAVDKQVIPICVIGNYSSGKSTFINALIGSEILPSGDDPITDSVYKMTRSQNRDCADVEFEYAGLPVSVHFEDMACRIRGVGVKDDPFIDSIKEKMSSLRDKSINVRINEMLGCIKEHKKEKSDISSLISISLPFSKEGVLSDSQIKYTIFDTPGAGSASNEGHIKVLEEQMKSLSNGLIMYVTDNKSLDKVEGKELCEKLTQMEGFDDRFTMIIVNKADDADLPEDGFNEDVIDAKLNQVIVRTLRSKRMFFVSSIIGLGAKNGGKFINSHYRRTFSKNIEDYEDENSEFYQRIYKYDIIPEQIKQRCLERSEREENKPFANSGLYWIENEIRTFSETYSPYNKCKQSKHFLDEIIDATGVKIDESRRNFEESKKTLEANLAVEEKECVGKLEKSSIETEIEDKNKYPEYMGQTYRKVNMKISLEPLEARQAELVQEYRTKEGYDEIKANSRIFGKNNKSESELKKTPKNKMIGRKSGFASDMKNQLQDFLDKQRDLYNVNKEIERKVAEQLFKEVIAQFDSTIQIAQTELDNASGKYWTYAAEDFKNKMFDLVTSSHGISDEKKAELGQIIVSYEPIYFNKTADQQFELSEFKKIHFKIGDFVVVETNKLNLRKLVSKYNATLSNNIDEIRNALRFNHENVFTGWANSLVKSLKEKIVKLNPELIKLQDNIDTQALQITNLTNRKNRLEQYQLEINNLMGWK
ncbi:dynamin family protein [Butyrivibrio fibrisolvens]|uniref:dynamin family protein n=1 Tax=Butyrivibrio fibrisolvens TaxID=831 RepID=UPI0003B52B8F|nr:dynamin family protein [Butyrivibrio fibrisolvens]